MDLGKGQSVRLILLAVAASEPSLPMDTTFRSRSYQGLNSAFSISKLRDCDVPFLKACLNIIIDKMMKRGYRAQQRRHGHFGTPDVKLVALEFTTIVIS
jgi:hypothetical protein